MIYHLVRHFDPALAGEKSANRLADFSLRFAPLEMTVYVYQILTRKLSALYILSPFFTPKAS